MRPPATPNNFAAVVVPTMADKLGASTFIRELTYMNILRGVSEDARNTTVRNALFFEHPLDGQQGHKLVLLQPIPGLRVVYQGW